MAHNGWRSMWWIPLGLGCSASDAPRSAKPGASMEADDRPGLELADGSDTGLADGGSATDPCNGVDDDGDGLIDEGSVDSDGDGVADCVDTACVVAVPPPAPVAIDDTCEHPVLDVPLELDVEWQWSGSPGAPDDRLSFTTPLVGHLHDSNGDGTIDGGDHPTVVISGGADRVSPARIVALDGVTGRELWTVEGRYPTGDMVLADVDADGVSNVVFVGTDHRVVALQADGTELWRSNDAVDFLLMFTPTLHAADLDGDGMPEVLAMNLILDGWSGETEVVTPGARAVFLSFWSPWAADLDRDGAAEVVLGDTVYDADGRPVWTAPIGHFNGCWSMPLDVDEDDAAEVVMVCGGRLGAYEADGTVKWQVAIPGEVPGPPCVADFDGDQAVELALATPGEFHMMELDGTVRWSQPVQDGISDLGELGGCMAFDVDRNGTEDVVYGDEASLLLLDGGSGTPLLVHAQHGGPTLSEYPVIADVDLDGEAELLVASSDPVSGWSGLTVLGHRHGVWPSPGSTWHAHASGSTGIEADGHIPSNPAPSWLEDNTWRARHAEDPPPVNVRPRIVDACAASCSVDGVVNIAVVIENDGAADVDDDVELVLWTEREGTQTELDRVVHSEGIAAGMATEGVILSTTVGALTGAEAVWVNASLATGAGGVYECNLTDNEVQWTAPVCP